ncbi:MAG: class I SAM-dependent rRNA methyltransferase [Candidatus Xenobia bacterium]
MIVTLLPGREKSLLRRHPWVFSGAVGKLERTPEPGQTVTVRAADGRFLATAAWSPQSQIVARVWSFTEGEAIDEAFFARRIQAAVAAREPRDATRLVYGESDGLPGVIVDRYGSVLVCQWLTAGAERWRETITTILSGLPHVTSIYERSDADVRDREGLPSRTGLLHGPTVPPLVEFTEGPYRFVVDVAQGHKTGFYLDQRDNREIVSPLCQGREVLNAFCYTGAFSVAAWHGGAKTVTSIDSAHEALRLAEHNLRLNGHPTEGLVDGDVFAVLRQYRDAGRQFDLVLLDPPKFAHREAQVTKATRAYKDINWLGMRLLRPSGLLVTFSCSGLVSEDLFQKVLFGASLDAGRDASIVRRLSQAGDHPVRLTCPEAAYLKGFVLRVE